MATNPIPRAYPSLMLQTQRAYQGATNIGASIPLLINTAAAIGTDREELKAAQMLYQNAAGAMTALSAAMETARSNAFDYCVHARDVIKFYCGRSFNQSWRAAGFINSIAVPPSEAGLHALLEALQAYFTSNPTHESPELNVTAANAGALLTALNTARAGIDTQRDVADTRRNDRDAKKTALQKRLGGLRDELAQRCDPLDPRWRDFGFNLPGAPTTPEVPQNVVVTPTLPGQLQVTCDASTNATHYRFFQQRPILDPEPIEAGDAVDPLFIITGLTPGQQYIIYVSAVNDGAESELSEPLSAETNAAAAA